MRRRKPARWEAYAALRREGHRPEVCLMMLQYREEGPPLKGFSRVPDSRKILAWVGEVDGFEVRVSVVQDETGGACFSRKEKPGRPNGLWVENYGTIVKPSEDPGRYYRREGDPLLRPLYRVRFEAPDWDWGSDYLVFIPAWEHGLDLRELTEAFHASGMAKGPAREKAEALIREACDRARQIAKGEIGFVGVRTEVFRNGVPLGQDGIWGFEDDQGMDDLLQDPGAYCVAEALRQARGTLDRLCEDWHRETGTRAKA